MSFATSTYAYPLIRQGITAIGTPVLTTAGICILDSISSIPDQQTNLLLMLMIAISTFGLLSGKALGDHYFQEDTLFSSVGQVATEFVVGSVVTATSALFISYFYKKKSPKKFPKIKLTIELHK